MCKIGTGSLNSNFANDEMCFKFLCSLLYLSDHFTQIKVKLLKVSSYISLAMSDLALNQYRPSNRCVKLNCIAMS